MNTHNNDDEREHAATAECSSCKRPLGWADRFYGRSGTCKRCTRAAEKWALRGKVVPPERMPHPTLSSGGDKAVAMAARPRTHRRGWNARRQRERAALFAAPEPPPAKRAPKTRASRRAKARSNKAKKAQAAA